MFDCTEPFDQLSIVMRPWTTTYFFCEDFAPSEGGLLSHIYFSTIFFVVCLSLWHSLYQSYFLLCLSFCLSISYPFLIVSTHSNVAGWRRMREMLTKQSVNSTIVVALRPPWVANEFNSYFILPFDLSICFAKRMFQKEKCVPHYCFYYSLQINSIVNKIYEKECKDSHWSFEI